MWVNSSFQIENTANLTYSCGFSLFLEDFLHLHSQIFDQLHSVYFFHFDGLYKLFVFLRKNTRFGSSECKSLPVCREMSRYEQVHVSETK